MHGPTHIKILTLLSTSFLLSCNFSDISVWCCLVSDICSSKLSYSPLIKLPNLLFTIWMLCCVSTLREDMSCDRLLVSNSDFFQAISNFRNPTGQVFSRFCHKSFCCSPPLTLLKLKIIYVCPLITEISLSTLIAVASSVSSNALWFLSDRVVILTLTCFYGVWCSYGVPVEACRLPLRGSVETLLLPLSFR